MAISGKTKAATQKQFKSPKKFSPMEAKDNDPTQEIAAHIKSNRAKRKGSK